MDYHHVPVMQKEVLEYLDPRPGGNYIDCTMGGGGYTLAIANKIAPSGKIISIDLDRLAIDNLQVIINQNKDKYKNIIIANDNFKNLQYIYDKEVEAEKIGGISGIVLDLGLSSAQLSDPDRGFSFKLDAPLNMSFGGNADDSGFSTSEILNRYKQAELEKIIKDYGEEKFYHSIAKKIVEYRRNEPITTTGQLVDIIRSSVPSGYRNDRRINCATRTFQALRIASNRELESLEAVLPQAISILESGGRLAIVSYHSLEDRIVKNYFRQESRDCLCPPNLPICNCGHKALVRLVNRKALAPTQEEIAKNPRARSAKLRVVEKQ